MAHNKCPSGSSNEIATVIATCGGGALPTWPTLPSPPPPPIPHNDVFFTLLFVFVFNAA